MKITKRSISFILALSMIFAIFVSVGSPAYAAGTITTTPTGYTQASDVKYVTSGGTIANWGARGEDCTFLSKYALSYYTGSYTYDNLSEYSGGSSQSNAKDSALYAQLKSMMTSKHDHQTGYGETKELYRYTDCVSNKTSNISSFYSGKELTGKWDGADTWNREHTWPNSKGLGGKDEDDIMMLRPTWVQENSSRGNTAYGEGSGYYDPGEAVRGDCARIVLYVYTRWGNTSFMWGKSGVMESMSVLLRWMEEDPVDTWEMGRNDSVESITGVRNVFVDYPEFAWLLFGQDIPTDMTTPSGEAANGNPDGVCRHTSTEVRNAKAATCISAGYTGDTYCKRCGELVKAGTAIAKNTNHLSTEVRDSKTATCAEAGYTGDTYCKDCGEKVRTGTVIAKTNNHTWSAWVTNADETEKSRECSVCGKIETASAGNTCPHTTSETRGDKAPTCSVPGYTGDTYCKECNEKLSTGESIDVNSSNHTWDSWVTSTDGTTQRRECTSCHEYEIVSITVPPVVDSSESTLPAEIVAVINSSETNEEQKLIIYLSLGMVDLTFLDSMK